MNKRNTRLVDVLIEMYPERRIQIERAASDFYAARQEQLGEQLVAKKILTGDELAIALARQRLVTGKYTRRDLDVLMSINDSQHERIKLSIDDLGSICCRLVLAAKKGLS